MGRELKQTCKRSGDECSGGGISACLLLACLSAWLWVLQVKVVSCHPGWTLTEGVEAAYGDSKRYLQPLRSLWQVGVAGVGEKMNHNCFKGWGLAYGYKKRSAGP